MLSDAHCHLDQIADPDEAIARAADAGVHRVLAVSQDLASMRVVLELKARHPRTVVAGLGIHPQEIPAMSEPEVDAAFRFLADHLADADVVGEIGLDHKVATTGPLQERQAHWLDRQLGLAAAEQKPVNLHSRRALRPVMEAAIAFQARSGCPAQLHWFTQSKKLVRLTNAAGVLVSVGPAILGAEDALAVAASVADDCLLLETDCPVPFAGASARPTWIARLLEPLAAARGVTPAALTETVERNFARLLSGELPERPARQP